MYFCISHGSECVCGVRVEDWVQVIAECPMCSDIKNLRGFGISWTDGRLDVSSVISTSRNAEQLAPIGLYARELLNGGDI